jgi:hypothetical protein
MKVKIKKVFDQKVSYDPKLDNIQTEIKAPIKEQKFKEMVTRIGEKNLRTLINS